jgi:hypothetical protein
LKKKAVWSIMLALFFIGITFNVARVSSSPQIRARAILSRHVFRGVGDIEDPWQNISVINPTGQTVEIESIEFDVYADDDFHLSWSVTPDMLPERWNTEVLPFEKSLVFYYGWLVVEGEPEGVYFCYITVHAVVMGEAIELKTKNTFVVLL